MRVVRPFTFFFLSQVFKVRCVFHTHSTSQFGLAAFLLEILDLTGERADYVPKLSQTNLKVF